MNYLVYPFKSMKITQSYNEGNHLGHTKGSPKEYPIDDAGINGGRDYFYTPCDKVKIVKLYGSSNVGYHVWMESSDKVKLANGKTDYITIMAVHLNYDDYKKLKIGQSFSRNDKMFREGTSGNATGNHIHFAVGLGKSSSNGKYWKKNSRGKWILITPRGGIKPEKAFFLDGTKVINSKKLIFKNMPKTEYISCKGIYNGPSIVDALKSIGLKSDFWYRKKLASKNGIKVYLSNASQNIKLLKLLKAGKCIKA